MKRGLILVQSVFTGMLISRVHENSGSGFVRESTEEGLTQRKVRIARHWSTGLYSKKAARER
jgi:hypothetical protein